MKQYDKYLKVSFTLEIPHAFYIAYMHTVYIYINMYNEINYKNTNLHITKFIMYEILSIFYEILYVYKHLV